MAACSQKLPFERFAASIEFQPKPRYNRTGEGPAVERRLAAILTADVVGYSRLMEADEVGTLAALQRHRDELIGR